MCAPIRITMIECHVRQHWLSVVSVGLSARGVLVLDALTMRLRLASLRAKIPPRHDQRKRCLTRHYPLRMPRRYSYSLGACVCGVVLVATLTACGKSSTSQSLQSSTSNSKHHSTTVATSSSSTRSASTTRPTGPVASSPGTAPSGEPGTGGAPGGGSGSGTGVGSSSTSLGGSGSTLPSWPRCTPDNISVNEGETQGAAGSHYQEVFIMNYGDNPCTLKGFPGVSLADSSGRAIGVPATRDGSTPTLVTLGGRAGEASFVIHTTADTTGGDCWPTSATINVYALGFTVMSHVDGAITVCGGEFEVSPIVAGRLDPSL